MRTIVRRFAAVLVAALFTPAGVAAAPAPFHVPTPVERALPNGLRVAVFADHRLPVVQIQLLVPAGTAQDPDGAPGVASAVAQLLRSGTSSRPAAILTADVDRLAGGLAGSAGRDYSTVTATFLAADFDAGLELLADVVVNPIFPPEELERSRRQLAARLHQAQQSPAALADARLWEVGFEGHPYARPPLGSPSTLARLDWEALRAFHGDHYRPDRAILAIAGDVEIERAFAAAADRFGDWAGRAVAVPAPAAPRPPAAPRVRVVDRPELARSEVRIGLIGPPQSDADALALQIAQHLFAGGGATSRLPRALAGTGLGPAELRSGFTILKDAALLSVGGAVHHDSVAILVARVRDELARLAEQPPDEAEVAAAQRTLAGAFPLQFQTPAALLAQWGGAAAHGLGADWLDRYVADVAAVPPAAVARAAARWLDPAHMVVVAVGPAATLVPALQALGAVEVAGAAEAAAAKPPAPAPPDAQQLRRGRRLLEEALAAHGGLARLRRVKDSVVEGTMIMQLAQLGGNDTEIAMLAMRKEPDRLRFSTSFGGVESGQVLNGRRGWVYAGTGDSLTVTEADSIGILAMRVVFGSDVVHTLVAAADPAAQVSARGPGNADGRAAEVVEVLRAAGPGGAPVRSLLYLDTQDHRLLAEDFAEDPARPGTFQVRRSYRDYRPVSGLQWPFYEERQRGGVKTMTIVLKSVKLDSGLTDTLFERPRVAVRDRPLR